MSDETTLHCYLHPERETLLRCNNCERPICTKCAVLTPRLPLQGMHPKPAKKFETAQATTW